MEVRSSARGGARQGGLWLGLVPRLRRRSAKGSRPRTSASLIYAGHKTAVLHKYMAQKTSSFGSIYICGIRTAQNSHSNGDMYRWLWQSTQKPPSKVSDGWFIKPVPNGVGVLFSGFIAWQIASSAYGELKRLWVLAFDPAPKTPAYKVIDDQALTTRLRVAVMDFPDPDACSYETTLESRKEAMKEMDWDKIDNSTEARVCMFRHLQPCGDVMDATTWLEAQGLPSRNDFSSTNP